MFLDGYIANQIKDYLKLFDCDGKSLVADAIWSVDRLLDINDSETEADLKRILRFTCEHYDSYIKLTKDQCENNTVVETCNIECRKCVRLIQQEIEEILELYVPETEDGGGNVHFFHDAGGGSRVIRGTSSLGG